MKNIHQQRFDELAAQLEKLEASKTPYHRGDGGRAGRFTVDGDDLLGWKVKVRSLLVNVCGADSEHLKLFMENESSSYSTNYENLQSMSAIFRAAKEDFEGGYLSSLRSIVQAEVLIPNSSRLLSCINRDSSCQLRSSLGLS
ncbi:MAG TPA: hypothetical protein VLX28_17145 [Thermoanaerobaculia bacterium]|nr:hypothetical protein [Thermoanaerobaculia bacterium]